MASRLGIMITKYADLDHIAGVIGAARKAGHPVEVFMTDEGVKFSRDSRFLELLEGGGVEVTVCEHNCETLGVRDRTERINYGSQYNNAGMVHGSGRLIVF
jgi:hypothetical protein